MHDQNVHRHHQPRTLIALAAAGSAFLLIMAFGFQAAGYAPCDLCILQRWPHAFAVGIGILSLLSRKRIEARRWAVAGAAALAFATLFAVYHAGIEWDLWEGPSKCTGAGDIAGLSVQDLMARINAAPVIRCDEVQWRFMTLSMAAWNAIMSAGLMLVWLLAVRVSPKRRK